VSSNLIPLKPSGTLEDNRLALDKEAIKNAFLDALFYMQGKFPALATNNDYYMALAYAVRDRMLQRWISTAAAYTKQGSRTVAYLSAEFLMGPHLGNNLINLGIIDTVKECMTEMGLNFEQLLGQEEEPGLGNGGLGRLAACFIDSLATLEVPAIGYGIRYEFGIFHQEIVDGWQIEKPTSGCASAIRGNWCGPSGRWTSSSAAPPSSTSTSTIGCASAGCRTRSSTACPTTR
jgi:starch phosphorylase